VEQQEYDEIVRTLVRITAQQDAINTRLTTAMEHHDIMIARHDVMIERLEGILVAIRELLQRGNGR
jgi:hypothetical protein